MRESKGIKILAYTTLSIVSILAVLPLILLFIGSVTDNATAIAEGFSYFPSKISGEAYKYIFDQWQESYLLTYIAPPSCEDYIYLLTLRFFSSLAIDGENQCFLDFPNYQSAPQFLHRPKEKSRHI